MNKITKLLVLLAFKIKKPNRVYEYYEECHGHHLSEFCDETILLKISFRYLYSYGSEQYSIWNRGIL